MKKSTNNSLNPSASTRITSAAQSIPAAKDNKHNAHRFEDGMSFSPSSSPTPSSFSFSLNNHSLKSCCPSPSSSSWPPHCQITLKSTKEVAGYNTISEAFHRLDFTSAISDIRRFNYVTKLLHLLINQNLTTLSGCATKVLFSMLQQLAWQGNCHFFHYCLFRKSIILFPSLGFLLQFNFFLSLSVSFNYLRCLSFTSFSSFPKLGVFFFVLFPCKSCESLILMKCSSFCLQVKLVMREPISNLFLSSHTSLLETGIVVSCLANNAAVASNQQNVHVLHTLLDDLKKMINNYYCWGRPLGSTQLWEQHLQTLEKICQKAASIEIKQVIIA